VISSFVPSGRTPIITSVQRRWKLRIERGHERRLRDVETG